MGNFKIRKGYNIRLLGCPEPVIEDRLETSNVCIYPLHYNGFKQRLKVKEGDLVKRGTEIMENKSNTDYKLCSPTSGTVKSVIRGARRFVEQIIIEPDGKNEAIKFNKYNAKSALKVKSVEVFKQLLATGYISLLKQRPFSQTIDIDAKPKSIFVNAMSTAPFHADPTLVVNDNKEAFQLGLNILSQLTAGDVNLCCDLKDEKTFEEYQNVKLHTFRGKHPAGNTSVHISKIDPMSPHDIIWTVNAVDLSLIGQLFLNGELPENQIVALGGPGIKEGTRKHYRIPAASNLKKLLEDTLVQGEQRLINGDILSGKQMDSKSTFCNFAQSSLTVIPEGRERRMLGWLTPGVNLLSFSKAYLTPFTNIIFGERDWTLHTNKNGGHRAIVPTGYYNKVMPMNIMVDFLIKAVLANDTDEAVKLGILETEPEDFALCEYICPCKTEIQEIIRNGLQAIEEEGL